jgi:ABC-type dipeptide/oligopeptide/nickel transport system permease subunit
MKEHSLWRDSWDRLYEDKWAIAALVIVILYSLIAILASFGIVAGNWAQEVGASNLPPSGEHFFGTDIFGRDVLRKVLRGTQVAMSVGLATSLIAIPIGVVLGCLAGYFGGWVDDLITWLYTTFSSIPNIMLLISITMILGKGLFAVYVALGATSWVTLCRLIRAEVMKHKEREYVQAAEAIGGGHMRKLFRHILPNVSHIVIINTSMQFQMAIKSEVILSYLGLGVQGEPSWGTMIDDAKLELTRGIWWQLAGATVAMFIIVLAFNVLGDALRDSLDPKLKGK